MMVADNTARTVLLVDDDPSDLKLYSWILNRAGYRAVTAMVGSSGVVFPGVREIDVAVMDYRLSSQLQGPDLARLIKGEFPDVPIILLSELPWIPGDMSTLINVFVTKGNPERLLEEIAQLVAANAKRSIDQ